MPITSDIFAFEISLTKANDSRQPKELMCANNNNNNVVIPDFENVLDSLHEVV